MGISTRLAIPTLMMGMATLACAQRWRLENGHWSVEGNGSRVTSLRADPSGQGHYGANMLISLGFRGLADTEKTEVAIGPAGAEITGLQAVEEYAIEVENGGVPELLQPGHTLGQSFRVAAGFVTALEVLLPTWGTAESSVTLSLRRGGPDGEVIAARRLENVPDNSWQSLTFPPQGPGEYYVELSEPEGQIGWWSSRDKRYADGQAYRDGRPDASMERAMRVRAGRQVGAAELTVSLAGPRLVLSVAFRPDGGEGPRAFPMAMVVPWDNEGYDCTAAAVPFFRFFTDTMRYMPVEQLKRWRERDGWYELSFQADRWIEAEGTGAIDLRFLGRRPCLRWHLAGKQTTLEVTVGRTPAGAVSRTEVAIEVLPREDSIPADWPRFEMPSSQEAQEANAFLYERAFTYPPVWGPAAWFEWNALARFWHGGRHLAEIAQSLESYPISPEGYVHTWGAGAGWPFPDNARYDTRHFDTNARFILACWRYAAWTGDVDFLRRQAERLRKAMEYQLTVLRGEEGLIVTASKDVTGRHQGVGNNYWDILPFGHLDAFANIVWYASIEAMAQIEEMLAAAGGVQTTVAARSPEYYRALRQKARRAYNETFWDDRAGRYIGCVDADGKRHDYGFTFVNLEAMAYGLADEEQARRIYRWMETEPTSTGKPDTYTAYVFAPRSNTIHNPMWRPDRGKIEDVPQEPWWHFGWLGTPYGDVQCQDGGAILYTSFFDLMARTKLVGADNAWRRWQEILGRWREPDHLCGGPPLFKGEIPQQINPGAVGTDIPFPESGLVPCWLLYGLMGVEATARGLEIAPQLPEGLPWLEVRNLAYRGLPLTLRVTREEAIITCDAPGYEFRWVRRLGGDGRVIFNAPPEPVRFPEKPLWEAAAGPWQGRWIWLEDSEAPRAFFRHLFALGAAPEKAWLAVTADNSFRLYVNGRDIGSGGNWAELFAFDLAPHLRTGDNVIAVEVENAGGPGGLVAQGEILLADGQRVLIATGKAWRVTDLPTAGWEDLLYDDGHWRQATEYGAPPSGPWGDIGDPAPPE